MGKELDRITITLVGEMTVTNAAGIDVTPTRMKERGLLALLALAPNHKKSREAIQDKLWSESETTQAQNSLRRALSNIRKAFGEDADVLGADRHSVWLEQGAVRVDTGQRGTGGELLEGLSVRDPEFENWRRDMLSTHANQSGTAGADNAGPVVSRPNAVAAQPDQRSRYLFRFVGHPDRTDEEFLLNYATDLLAKRLLSLGDVDIVLAGFDEVEVEDPLSTVTVELRSLVQGDDWHVHLRLLRGPHNACFWADRTSVPFDYGSITGERLLGSFVSKAFGALISNRPGAGQADQPRYMKIQNAARLLFSGDYDRIMQSQQVLAELAGGAYGGITGAWLGFGKLTEVLEFGDTTHALVEEALQLSDESLLQSATNPVVPALAAIVNMKLGGDFDYGRHLSDRAVSLCDQNPYALNAASQAAFFFGDHEQSYRLAMAARDCAEGMPNIDYWDIQACLAALGAGRIDEALAAAQQSHLRSPRCRPPLRYLVALNLLKQDMAAAEKYAARLRKLEPGFGFDSFFADGYPVETLRRVGMLDQLRDRLG